MTGSPDRRRGRLWASAAAVSLLVTGCSTPSASPTQPVPATSAPSPSTSSSSPHFADVRESAYRRSLSSSGDAPSPSATPVSTPPASASASSPASAPSASASTGSAPPSTAAAEEGAPDVLPASEPVSVSAPEIGLDSELLHLGLRDDGALEVPSGDPGTPAAWYIHSPTPGERGPAVLLGHVSAYGNNDGVFRRLSELEPGGVVSVEREDGTTAVFEVDRVEEYGKDDFPTDEVYGNTERPELRMITCDGYNPWTRTFEDNRVVYAHLVEAR